MKKTILLSVILIPLLVIGQIQSDIEPYSAYYDIQESAITQRTKFVSPTKSISTALLEDEEDRRNGKPPRFGLRRETEFNTVNSGVWIDLPNGDKLWLLSIKSPNAKSINLLYSQFHIPRGGMLHIYNKKRTHIIGAFTERNNKGSYEKPGQFATGLVYGDEIILEYYHPESGQQQPIINISGVIHGYKYIDLLKYQSEDDPESGGYGQSGSCQVDINCSEGNGWQDEKRGVALLLINGGTRWCSGSLVNNTSRNAKPFFLSADHCLTEDNLDAQGNTNASQYMFYWNYERAGCNNGGPEPTIYSTTGASLKANRADSDFALFLLTESPKDAGYNVFFNGWDRTTTPMQGGVGIHHPSGDVKKISTHNVVPGPGSVFGANTHWRVNWLQTLNGHSVTEGGSSGSPLFMNNGRIIGQLHGGGFLDCQVPELDPGEYGRFDVSWNGSSPTRRLRDWLDPFNTGETYLNGQDIFSDIVGDDCACASPNEVYTLTNPPSSINWQYPTSLLTSVGTSGSTITLKAKNAFVKGYAVITARNASNNAIVRIREIYVGKPETPISNISGPSTVNYGALVRYTYHGVVPGAKSFDWWLPFPYTEGLPVVTDPAKWNIVSGGTFSSMRCQVGPNDGLVQFFGVNPCGTSGAKTKNVTVVGSGGGGGIPLLASIGGINNTNLDKKLEEEKFLVYPNPTKNQLSLLMDPEFRKTVYEISLFDVSGRLLFNSQNKSLNQIDLSTYQTGIYSLKITSQDGNMTKIVAVEK
ncbi:MAG: T9SS type A sorting domain-containing protein [Allomuricauda sp.]